MCSEFGKPEGRTADPSTALRSGRDDNSVCALRVCYGGFGKSEGRTADPSAALRSGRDDNSVCALRVCYRGFGKSEGRTADPSAALRSGRDSAVLSGEIGLWMRGTAGPSAPVPRQAGTGGVTILFGNARYRFQDEVSSRPERTRISCHAALDKSA
jgi:hypothetical protein